MKFLLDTNVYIEASASARGWQKFEDHILPILPFTYLSSVVAFELGLAGKEDEERLLNHHIVAMKQVGRLVTPAFEDWVSIVSKMKKKYKRSQLCNVLIGQCARQIGALLFTFDYKDFVYLSKSMGFKIRKPW